MWAFQTMIELGQTMTTNERFKVWEGVYKSFSEVPGNAKVFGENIWLQKVEDRARIALLAAQSDKAIAPVAETHDYALPVVAALAARRGKALRILDFGGGLASSYIPLVKMLPTEQELDFVIVENEAICEVGRELLVSDNRVSFISQLPNSRERFDIVHCGSSLHYVDDWSEFLERAISLCPTYLLFSDLPAADNRTLVTAQMYHGARIPVRFWNLNEFITKVESLGYCLLLKARYRGSFLDDKEGVPTEHFELSDRLSYFSQLVFQSKTSIGKVND